MNKRKNNSRNKMSDNTNKPKTSNITLNNSLNEIKEQSNLNPSQKLSNNISVHSRRASMEPDAFLTSKLYAPRKSIHPFLNFNGLNFHKEEDLNLQKQLQKSNEKKKEMKMSNKMKQRRILDKLYGVTPSYIEKYQNTQKQKQLDLDAYQNNLLNFFSTETNIDKRDFMDLLQNFDEIKENSASVNPLPKINVDNIIDNVKNQKKGKNDKMLTLKEYLNKNKNRKKDEFEKEQELIEKSKKFKVIPKKKRNRNLDLLPPYLREVLNKQLKFHQ